MILWLRSMGKRVRIVVVTDGSASTTSEQLTPDKLAALRQTEMRKAAALLGVSETDVVFLSYRDGKASESIASIAKDLHAQIWLCAPDWVLSPYGIDGHADHRAVASALKNLQDARKITARVLAYPIWFWPRGAFSHLCGKVPFQNLYKLEACPFLKKRKKRLPRTARNLKTSRVKKPIGICRRAF
jgi:LmbE family N-acetylglucosaminyl deacetylase